MTYRHRWIAASIIAGFSLLSACSLFGQGPSEHTVIDYESLEPRTGHGADYDEKVRYGRTEQRGSSVDIEEAD